MSAMTGKSWKVKRVNITDFHLGGLPTTPEPRTDIDTTEEAGTSQYELVVQEVAAVYPRLRLPMKVLRLENYIADFADTNKFCFVSEQGALSVHDLYVTDGLDSVKLADCLVNSCEVVIPIRGSVTATMEIFAKTRTAQAYGSDPTPITDAPLMHTNVEVMSVGAHDISADFQEFRFDVAHNIQQEVLGKTVTPTEVIQRHTVYTGGIRRALKTQSWEATAYIGTKQDIILQINDNQGVTKKTEFTWTDAIIEAESKPVPGLGMIVERIGWRAKKLTLAEGS